MPHDTSLPLRDALARYFADNGFGADGGYTSAWVDFKLGPIPCPFPNSDARKRAVRFHDLHHLVTEYRTDLVGEFEISAWELGSGCRDYYAAWQLNLGGLFGGLLFAPRRAFRAFVRGRRMQNFYGRDYAPLLDLEVGAARRELGATDTPPVATAADVALFLLASVAGVVVGLATMAVFLPLALVAAPFLTYAERRSRRLAEPPHATSDAASVGG